MTIDLKPEQERIIRERIAAGQFASPAEVLDYALATLAERESSPRKSLVEVLSSPPFAGSELDLERQRDYSQPLDL